MTDETLTPQPDDVQEEALAPEMPDTPEEVGDETAPDATESVEDSSEADQKQEGDSYSAELATEPAAADETGEGDNPN